MPKTWNVANIMRAHNKNKEHNKNNERVWQRHECKDEEKW
jgi:hypothetical protein